MSPLAALLFSMTAAPDRAFAYLEGTATIEPSEREIQVDLTSRFARQTDTAFGLFEGRAAVRFGVAPNLETSLGLEFAPSFEGAAQGELDARVRNRWRFSPMSVREHRAFTLTLGADAAAGVRAVELGASIETALKAFAGFEWALNASFAHAFTGDAAKADTHLEQTTGLGYTLANGWTFAFEARNRISYARTRWVGDALYLGPSLTLRGQRLWASVAIMAQVAALKPKSSDPEPLELTDNERFQIRLAFGFTEH